MRVAISKSMDIVIDLLNVIPIIVDMVFYHVVSLFDIIRYFSSYNPFINEKKSQKLDIVPSFWIIHQHQKIFIHVLLKITME